MTDRIRTLHARIGELSGTLIRRALADDAAAAYPSSGDGPHVSSSAVSSPTESAGTRDLLVTVDEEGKRHIQSRLNQAGDYQTIERAFARLVDDLEKIERRTATYEATGEPCPNVARNEHGELVSCTGTVTHFRTGRGLCESCDDWHAKPQHRGLDMPVEVLKARNQRRVRMCDCGPDCCPRDAKGHTACTDRAAEGRTVSERCHGRMSPPRCQCGPECCPDGCAGLQEHGRYSERCHKRRQRAS